MRTLMGNLPEDWWTIGATVFVVLLAILVVGAILYYRYSLCLESGFTADQCFYMIGG